jgi:hypothetical protein
MFAGKSRYGRAKSFDPEADGAVVFAGVRPRDIGPATGLIEYRVQAGDRLDLLARNYYNDDRLWWRILDANPQLLFGGVLLPALEDVTRVDQADATKAESGENEGGGKKQRSSPPQPEDWVGRVILIPRAQED